MASRFSPTPWRSAAGYLPENNPLYEDMIVREYVEFVGKARGLQGSALKTRLDWVVEASGIAGVYHKQINELSKGFKQRTGLAQALVHDPDILILDEPTSGLDPLQIIGIRELIHSLARQKTIIFSTHILQEVSPITDRVVIINNGRIIADGLIPELEKDAMGSNRVYVSFRADADRTAPAVRGVEGVESASLLGESDGVSRFEVRGGFEHDLSGGLSALARSNQWELLELHESHFSLEDTFIALTRRAREAGEVAHV